MSVNELAKLILKLTNSNSDIQHFNMRAGEDENLHVPLFEEKTAADILNYGEAKSIISGMNKTIEYYESIGRAARKEALAFYEAVDET